ncbi:MAG: Na+/H+ antiporter NhaA [Dehalococcoidia bacterium]
MQIFESTKHFLKNDPTPIERIVTPFQRFGSEQAAGGIILFLSALIAILWANFISFDSYDHFWHTKFTIGIGDYSISDSFHFWINDGLMAIFFFLVGLEIKRSIVLGELSSVKKAAFPVFAAAGGMLVPAGIFIALNLNTDTFVGWGIPVATDIAFALGVLSVLGKRVPVSLKIFLTALAIADDIGAVLIIAIFYSNDLMLINLFISFLLIASVVIANSLGLRNPLIYTIVGCLMWIFFLKSGIHATIAGITLAMVIPLKVKINPNQFFIRVSELLHHFKNENNFHQSRGSLGLTTEKQSATLEELVKNTKEVESPLQRMENNLHHFVTFIVLPLFAISNSGVIIDSNISSIFNNSLAIGIILGLFVGKPVGIFLFSYLACKIGIASIPNDLKWRHVLGVGFLGGVGFTMAIFVNGLAFDSQSFIDTAKIAIFIASIFSAIFGYMIIRLIKTE